MGKRKRRSHTQKNTRDTIISINLVLFIVAITLFVLLRLTSLRAIVFDGICGPYPSYFKPDWEFQSSPIETFTLAAGLVVLVQIIWAIQNRRRSTWPPFVLGTINILAASGVILYCLVSWSFFNPSNALAKYVNSWGQVYELHMPLQAEVLDWERDYFERSPNWVKLGTNEFANTEMSITARYEIIRECFSEEFDRLNFEARHPNQEFIPNRFTDLDWVYFDHERRLIAPKYKQFDWTHSAAIARLPSPDWRTHSNRYWELMVYIERDATEIYRGELEPTPSLEETYDEIIRILDER